MSLARSQSPDDEAYHERLRKVQPLEGPALDRLYTRAVAARIARAKETEAYLQQVMDKLAVNRKALTFRGERSAQQLFYFPMKHKKEESEKLQEKYSPERERGHASLRLSEEELRDVSDRLCHSGLEKKREEVARLSDTVYPKPKVKKMAPSDLQEASHRLCQGSLEHKMQTMNELEKKYSWHPSPSKVVSKAEVSTIADRMYKGER
jgi:hypothetical protein